ncbi:uncharacterized protein BKA78DRAFT_186243 [Phyllosticta capitalensis]|uniref:uncharacterized protein n=1 Tax=Phyllosticta capitalensis TaxID=121624 RepID=UPI00313171B4
MDTMSAGRGGGTEGSVRLGVAWRLVVFCSFRWEPHNLFALHCVRRDSRAEDWKGTQCAMSNDVREVRVGRPETLRGWKACFHARIRVRVRIRIHQPLGQRAQTRVLERAEDLSDIEQTFCDTRKLRLHRCGFAHTESCSQPDCGNFEKEAILTSSKIS